MLWMTSVGLLDKLKVCIIEEPWFYFDHFDLLWEICDHGIFVALIRSLTGEEESEFYPTYVYNFLK